jgi:NAD(P)-dependent dehydrogenase (short-subunit alcohol dehydrogenase family)
VADAPRFAGEVAVVTGAGSGLGAASARRHGGASIVSSVRPSGGAGAWDTAAVDRAMYGPR